MSSPAPRQLISGARHAYLALEPKPHACVSERRKERLRDGGGRCCREREEAARRSVWNLPRRVELNYGLEMCLVAPHGALVSQHALHSPREVPGKGSRRLLFRKVFQAFSMLCALASFPPTCRLVCDPPARYSGHQDHSVPSSPSFCNVCCMLARVCSCRRKKRAPAHRLAYLTAGLQHEASFSLPAREVRNSRSRPPPALDGHRGLWVSEQCPSGHVAFQPRVCSVPPPRRRRRRWEWGTRWRV